MLGVVLRWVELNSQGLIWVKVVAYGKLISAVVLELEYRGLN
jgi:hypothetical protein